MLEAMLYVCICMWAIYRSCLETLTKQIDVQQMLEFIWAAKYGQRGQVRP